MNIQPIARISLDKVREESLDEIDKALSELRYGDAQDRIKEIAKEPKVPLPWLEWRLAELLFFWNESVTIARVTDNLEIWMTQLSEGQRAEVAALRERPEPSAIRQWLRCRDRWGFRRLQATYLPSQADLVQVDGGSFSMGEGSPPREVELDTFFLAPLPVTARQFALYLQAHETTIPQAWVTATEAARGVRFSEAIAYCNWLTERKKLAKVYDGSEQALTCDHSRDGFRLPTEAEWEYAARGGRASGGHRYAGADRLVEVGDATGTDPVGLRFPNELGIYDMSGGRAEWCWDWYAENYGEQTPSQNPKGPPEGKSRVCRGGDVTGAGVSEACSVYAREGAAALLEAHRSMNIGFRLARRG